MAEEGGPHTVAEISEKGGVGKTSVTAGLIAAAAEEGLKVAGVDLDPRATLTNELGVRVDDARRSVNSIYYVDTEKPHRDPAEIAPEILVSAGRRWPGNVFLLPGHRKLGNREGDQTTGMEFRLARALWGLRELVDVVFIDTPPRPGGKLVGSALIAANKVVMPTQVTKDGFLGIEEALISMSHYTGPGGLNPGLKYLIVRNLVPKKKEYRAVHEHWSNKLVETHGDAVVETQFLHYAVRETCRTGSAPITAAPGREAKLLLAGYRSLLHHAVPHLKGRS